MRALITHVYGETEASLSDKAWSAHEITSASLALSTTRDDLASQAAIMEVRLPDYFIAEYRPVLMSFLST